MIADRNRRQRRKPRRTGGGATCPSVASLGDYAGFDRLIAFQPGELNANKGGIIGTPARKDGWSLDMTGNWPGYVQKTSGSTDLDQGRTHNPVNEITAITATTGTDWADPEHDRNGNMTTIPELANLADDFTAIYDAWNRLVEVKDGQTVIARYEYDGLNRRIESHIDSGAPSNSSGIDTYVHCYYTSSWQILETRQSDTPSAQPETLQPKHQFVWSQRYIDAPVLRDENTGANGLCDDDRLDFLNDANFNVTALVDTAGDALERYVHSPYGVVTIYDATWTNTRSTSSYANVTLYTGRELDPETGLYYYRNRYYGARLGRFVSRDLIGYDAGDISLYRCVANAPVHSTDPFGKADPREVGPMGMFDIEVHQVTLLGSPEEKNLGAASIGYTIFYRPPPDFEVPRGTDIILVQALQGPAGIRPRMDVSKRREGGEHNYDILPEYWGRKPYGRRSLQDRPFRRALRDGHTWEITVCAVLQDKNASCDTILGCLRFTWYDEEGNVELTLKHGWLTPILESDPRKLSNINAVETDTVWQEAVKNWRPPQE